LGRGLQVFSEDNQKWQTVISTEKFRGVSLSVQQTGPKVQGKSTITSPKGGWGGGNWSQDRTVFCGGKGKETIVWLVRTGEKNFKRRSKEVRGRWGVGYGASAERKSLGGVAELKGFGGGVSGGGTGLRR